MSFITLFLGLILWETTPWKKSHVIFAENRSNVTLDYNAQQTGMMSGSQPETTNWLMSFFRRDCVIKGNINSRGERIYHTPSSPWYSQTRISPLRGERWFCSEEEARAAGWRAPRG